MAKKFNQGIFKLMYPDKYVGDPQKIVFRSGWESKVMYWLDHSPSVEAWTSENVQIPYFDPVRGKVRRYFPDFTAKIRDKNSGELVTWIIEIKPAKERVPPDPSKIKSKKRLLKETTTYMTNQAKWKSVSEFCARKGWKFVVKDEYDLGIKVRPRA